MAATHDPEKMSSHAKEHHSNRREQTRHSADETEQLVFTINVKTGGIVKLEKVDAHGKRREIPKEETIALASKDNLHEIDMALDEAFEAGITSVLESGSSPDTPDTDDMSAEDLELRHALLTGLINRGVRQRLQRRLVQRLILSKARAH